jgi:AAA ATPase
MFERPSLQSIKERIAETRRFIQVIVGPRQVGKTTLVTQLLPQLSIGSHLINSAVAERYSLYYWREGNNEVDFILEKDNKTIGLEVKSGMKAGNAGMGVFVAKFHPAKVLLIGTGGIPHGDFLKINPRELF